MLQDTEIEKSCNDCIHCDTRYDSYEYDTTFFCTFNSENSDDDPEINPAIADDCPNYEEYPTKNVNS